MERRQFLSELGRVGGVERKLKEEVEGEIAEKLREMRVIHRERERNIAGMEGIKSDTDQVNTFSKNKEF